MKNACPCCGNLTINDVPPGTYEVCPVCGWEDDEVQFLDPNFSGGANRVSLETARANYQEFGAVDRESKLAVRSPRDGEHPRNVK